MALKDFPVLPETYPLFDWSEWQESYDALVPGGETKAFQKACWNAIVDTMAEAIEAGGLEWPQDNVQPDDIKMYGPGISRITAKTFNAMSFAIDSVFPLRWIWEYDTAFRGYVGRWYFYASSERSQDVVYPEYIKELVKRMNMALEMMRGTLPVLEESAEVRCDVGAIIAVKRNRSKPVSGKFSSKASFSKDAFPVIIGSMVDFPKARTYSDIIAKFDGLTAGVIYGREKRFVNIRANGNVRPAAEIYHSSASSVIGQAAIDFLTLVTATMASNQSKSIMSKPAAAMMAAMQASAEKKLASLMRVSISGMEHLNLSAQPESEIIFFGEIANACGSLFHIDALLAGNMRADLTLIDQKQEIPALWISAVSVPLADIAPIGSLPVNERTSLRLNINPGLQAPPSVNCAGRAGLFSSTRSGLKMTQAQEVETNHVSVLSASFRPLLYGSRPVFAEKKAAINVTCQMAADSIFLPTESTFAAKSILYVSSDQAISRRVHAEGRTGSLTSSKLDYLNSSPGNASSSNVTNVAASAEARREADISVSRKLKSNPQCEFDRLYWEFPVEHNGGLLIRQAYSIEQYDTGELGVR